MTQPSIKRWLMTALIIPCLGMAGCGGGGAAAPGNTGEQMNVPTGGQLDVGMAQGDIDSLDPQVWYFSSSWTLANGLCTTLLRYQDKPGSAGVQLTAGLADLPSVSPDGTRYTFKLRTAKFATGRLITGQDIKYSIERMLTPSVDPGTGQYFSEVVGAAAYIGGKAKTISGITASRDRVKFTLNAADGAFPYKAALPNTCPVPVGTEKKPEGGASLMSKYASGPYKVSSYVPNRSMTWVRNSYYNPAVLGQRGRVDEVRFRIGVDPSQAVLDIKAGNLDAYTGFFNTADNAQLSQDVRFKSQVIVSPRPASMFLWLNNTVAPFGDVNVRKAVNYAIDRTQAEKAFGGPEVATPTDQILPATLPGFRRLGIYPNTPDLVKAKALMAASGMKLPVRTYMYTRNDGAGFVPVAQVIQANLSAIGIDVSLKTAPDSVASPIYQNPKTKTPMALSMQSSDFPDGEGFINPLLDPQHPESLNNVARFHDQSFVPAFRQVVRMPVGSRRANAYISLDQSVMTKAAPVAMVLDANRFDFVSNRVAGYVYSQALDGINLNTLGVK